MKEGWLPCGFDRVSRLPLAYDLNIIWEWLFYMASTLGVLANSYLVINFFTCLFAILNDIESMSIVRNAE